MSEIFSLKISSDLSLVLPDPSQAPPIYKQIDKNRESLREWLDFIDNTNSFLDIEKNIRQRLVGFYQNKSAAFFVKYKGKYIASAGFVKINHISQRGEIGYWLLPECRGQGIITNSVKALN